MPRPKLTFVQGTIKYRRIIYLVLFAVLALGVFGLIRMNKDEFPTFDITEGLVVGVYPGATAAQVEEQLTKPLEQTLFGFSEVDRSTYSYSKDGICYIYVMTNMPIDKKDEVWAKIRLALDNEKTFLPAGVLAVQVIDDFSSISSILIALESPDKDYSEMTEYADNLCDRLRSLKTLSYAKLYGTRDEEIAVTVDPERLSAYGIDPSLLMLDYQSAGMPILSGTFDTDYATSPIHVTSLLGGEREVAEKIVYSDPSGNIIRLRDIATIDRRYSKPSSTVRYNGGSCLVISVEMRPDHDIVSFGKEVDAVLDEFRATVPDSVTVTKVTDQPRVVGNSVWGFVRDLGISMLVVILVMLLIFPFRSAMIAGLGVPICTLVALAVMYFTKIGLNTVTLAALITCLGMIVDDAIISIDGYMDYLKRGMGRLEAATRSTNELAMPMALATFAIGLMLFPMNGILTGYFGAFVRIFPWVLLIALTASLIYALVIVPPLEIRYITSPDPGTGWFARLQGRFFKILQSGYEWLEERCFRRPGLTLAIGAAVILLGVFMFTRLNVQMLPMAERDCFAVEIYLDANSGIEDTEAVCDSLQRILQKDKRIRAVTSFIGSGSPRFHATYIPKVPGKNFAQLIVNTVSNEATVEVLKEYGSGCENLFPNARVRFKQIDYQACNAPVEIKFKGASWQEMKPWADSLENFMLTRPDLMTWVHTDIDDFTPTVEVSLDPDESARLGVNKTLLSLSLYGTFNGLGIGTVWEDGTKIPVKLYSSGITPSAGYEVIANQPVSTAVPGVSVPLRQVASITPDWQPESIPHTGGCESVTVSADMVPGMSHPKAMKAVKRYIGTTLKPSLPPDIKLEYGGLSEKNEVVIPQIILSFICAVAVLFLFLLIHFKKISLSIMTIILSLTSLFGAAFGLWIFGLDFGITSVLGFVSLVGITVKNGIIIFEEAENLRYGGRMDVRAAALEAGKRRMRPIFLASCTTALGVIPMIISRSALWMPLGVVICFGIVFSIVLLVLLMPVSYYQLYKNAKAETPAEDKIEKEESHETE